MDIIITHENADFDAFASTVAAQKLYPEAAISLGRRVSKPLRDFLALHKDRFRAKWQTDIDQHSIDRVILVDVRRASRLKGWEPLIARIMRGDASLHIYDHHAASKDDLIGDFELVEPVGSATTLFVELMQERGIVVDTIEATLLALGIYTDTGSLTYAGTTPRDAQAVAWLLGLGASLKMVNRYLSTAMSTDQREIFSKMLGAVQVYEIGGVDVGFVEVPLERSVNNLAVVTTQVVQLEGHDALFALFPFAKKKRVQIIARSLVPYIDVGEVLKKLGGGGHASAGAAVVKKGVPDEIRAVILEALQADPPRPRTVMDVMSSPVRSIGPKTLLSEVEASLKNWQHTGMPVVKEGTVVGIISRRDVNAAVRGNRLHLPVSSCMSSPVKTVTSHTTLADALDLMVDADVGRLPVVDDGHLMGILSRSDALRVLYREKSATPAQGEP